EVNLPALMALTQKASSIGDLVRFFSDSPLDGLRGEATPTAPDSPAAARP
ncbi:MAG TPA: alpha/beta hydrolase, partial [Cyanobium sp.]|nr:alpha/beta hydrolase [Cyanobium sp.]